MSSRNNSNGGKSGASVSATKKHAKSRDGDGEHKNRHRRCEQRRSAEKHHHHKQRDNSSASNNSSSDNDSNRSGNNGSGNGNNGNINNNNAIGICNNGCNDGRVFGEECFQPYVIPGQCGIAILNVRPPACIFTNSAYVNLYTNLYAAIANNSLYNAFSTMIQANSSAAYDAFLAQLLQVFAPFGLILGTASPRLLVAESDGTVVIDTSRAAGSTNANTYANWQAKLINENHNTRVAVMAAQMFPCGVGYETKFSSTLGISQSYVGIRGGPYLNNPGTFRLSINT